MGNEIKILAATSGLPACLLNPRVLAVTTRLLVWEVPAERRVLRQTLPSGDISELYVPWPRLLMAMVLPLSGPPELHVVALRRQGRVQEQSPLYHAPLMNINLIGRLYDSGLALPHCIDPRRIEEFDRLLLDFPFTLVGHERTLRPEGMAAQARVNSYHHSRCWREISRAGLARFPGRSLVARRQTVGQWISALQSLSLS